MYSPKISEILIPRLYRRARREEKFMTELVDEIIRENMEDYYERRTSGKVSVCGSCMMRIEVDEDQDEVFCEQCGSVVFVLWQ